MDPPKRQKLDEPCSLSTHEETLDHHDDTLQDDDAGDDIISDLPDALLCHILSKLPTKHAVGASILSSKWKNLFSSIPRLTLEFDDSLLLHPDDTESSVDLILRRKLSFMDFTYRVLDVILQDVNQISQFCLKCCQEYDDSHILCWVNSALKKNAKLLDLGISMKSPVLLLNILSNCAALKYLSLGKNLSLEVPDTFCLPNLKYLLLDEIEFVDDESIVHLFAGCPALEDLSMCDCDMQHIELLNISIPSLKGLIIEYCYDDEIGYQVALDTPLLEMLIFKDHAAIRYYMSKLANVRQAHIEIGGQSNEDFEYDSIYYNQNIAEFVAACSTADSLFLSRDTIRAVRESCYSIPVFGNLKWMQLAGFNKSGWELLPQLLECSPNLEWFEITEGFYEEGCYASFESNLPEKVAVCLTSHVKKIDFWSFTGEEDEVKLVEYFLRTAKVLDKMEICCDLSKDKYFTLKNRLARMPRISETCALFLPMNKKVMEY